MDKFEQLANETGATVIIQHVLEDMNKLQAKLNVE